MFGLSAVAPGSIPCQLMVGFFAYAKSFDINVDKEELEGTFSLPLNLEYPLINFSITNISSAPGDVCISIVNLLFVLKHAFLPHYSLLSVRILLLVKC